MQNNVEEKDCIREREDERDWRIMFGNINGFPTNTEDSSNPKMDQFQYLLETAIPDVLGISEHGKVINRLRREEQPSRIMKNWGKDRINRIISRFSWLQGERDDRDKTEVGGTGIITMNKGTNHTIGAGEDSDKLGRWNWVTINGKKNRMITIISIYRPRESQKTAVRQSAVLSRKRKIEALTNKTTTTWREDLRNVIKDFQEKKHEIVIGGDFNDDLNNDKGEIRKFMKEMGLREVLIEAYGKGPATHFNGSTTIDGIFCTDGIQISNGGYIRREHSPSDHRWPWIDIKEKHMTGKNRNDFVPPIDRRATSKIPKVKKKFQDLLEEQITKHNLHERMERLTQQIGDNEEMTFDQQAEYETIEIRFRRAIKYADRNCRKVRRGKVPFSNEIKRVMAKIRVQKLVKLRLILKGKNNRPRMRKLKRYANKVKYDGPLEFQDLEEANNAIKESYKEYRRLRPSAKDLRQRYIYEIAEDMANDDDKGRDAEWFANKMIREEEIKTHFQEIKKSEKKNIRGGVEKVLLEKEDGSKKIVTDKEEIAEAIKQSNMTKRLQAEGTPLRTEPLSSLLGEQMDYEKWEEILHGQIQLPEEGVEEGTRLWYELMQSQKLDEFKIEWTAEEYIESWKKIDENKSSMPGIQAAHIKCIGPKTKAAVIISQLALIPLKTGYAPITWEEGIDSMIPKKIKGECRPEKLRLILLFDARFNHNNKLIGKKMMEFAEKNGLLAKEQFGSRKNKSAIEHAVNKRLTLDFSRQFKLNCVYIANDAKSCYDRILLIVAYLMMRQSGLDERATISSISTLVGMEMKIRTAHGISKVTYGGLNWKKYPHGIGQGNGYGPAIWALISSPLLYLMRRKGYGTSINTPITKETLRMAGFSFVDDTDQCEMTMNNKKWEEQLLDTQKSIDLWESLLRTTGGAIEPTKSDWTKLKFKWKGSNAEIEKHSEDEKLYMNGPNGKREELQKIEATEARETLGVWQAANGQEKTQVEKLKEKVQDWGSKINSSHINPKETTTAVTHTIGKTIRYPLAATAIDEKLAAEVDKELRKAALGKMNIVRTAPTIPVEAPTEYGGLGIASNLYKNQMIDHSIILMNHGHRETTTGVLLRIALEALAVEAGVGGDPGNFNIDEIDWVTENTWIRGTLESYNEHDIELHTSIAGLKTWTNRDEFLMEVITRNTSRKEDRILNKVRMYLKVATFSDIVTADGKQIDENILKGERSTSPSPSFNAYNWPNVSEPTKAEKKLWTETICKQYNVTKDNRNLGSEARLAWDERISALNQWSYDEINDTVYEKVRTGYKLYRPNNIRHRRRKAYFYEEEADELTERVQPVTVQIKNGGTYIQSKGEVMQFNDEENEEAGWILRHIKDNDREIEKLAEEIRNGTATFVSDGSYKNGRSSSAVTTVPRKKIQISNTVPGNKSNQSSYRGELGGILAAIVYANKIANEKKVKGKAKMICDNKGALNAAFGWRQINARWQCYDILCMIRYHLSISPIKWESQHVKGHQDKKIPYEDLDVIAQANVDVDKLAKIELRKNITVEQNKILQGQSWRLYCKATNTWITGCVEKEMREICYERVMRTIWENKCKNLTISDREWENFKKLNKECPEMNRRFIFKYGMNILPTKRNMARRKHSDTPNCPSCDEEESTDHLIQCKNGPRRKVIGDEKEDLNNELRKHTNKSIREAILYLLECFQENKEPQTNNDWEKEMQDAVIHQWERGQRAFFLGFWCREWEELQEKFHKRTATRVRALTKIRHMIRGCQKFLKNIWKQRNEEIHRNEESAENKRKHEELNKKIEEIYKKKKRIPNAYLGQDARIFRSKEDKIRRMKVKRKERWVRNAEAIMSKYKRGNERKEAKLMRSYFMPSNYRHKDEG